jgi:hypothetical protein
VIFFFFFLGASKVIGYRLEMLINLLIEPDHEVDIYIYIYIFVNRH